MACNIGQKHFLLEQKSQTSTSVKDFRHLGRPSGWGEGLPGDDGGDNQHGGDDQRGCGDQHGGEGSNFCHLGCGRHQDYHCVVL